MRRIALLTGLLISFESFAQTVPNAIAIYAGEELAALQGYALQELQQYCGRMFDNTLVIANHADAAYRIILGTPTNNSAIKEAADAGTIKLPEGVLAAQGYSLKSVENATYVGGVAEQGVLYGVYALLEEYGAYFQISGERIPAKRAFAVQPVDRVSTPVFKYRGLLPWDNFLCGMSGYNLEDYQALIDRAARMKLNMLQFHFYPGMAFFTETVNGVRVPAAYIGIPVDAFPTAGAVGEAAFKGETHFAPRPYVENLGNPEAQADAVQAMMRTVLDYAKTRGMSTCVGFELMHPITNEVQLTDKPEGGLNFADPLRAENVEISLQRYRSLQQTYPQSDYYWLWQSEARGYLSRQAGREPGAAEMRAAQEKWAGIADLAGDIDYAYHFREVANRLTPEERTRLATGGWTIQHLFPGIHPDMPPEVRFASLNPYPPNEALEKHVPFYQVAQQGRPTWMIDWWEFDGEQWFPQFRITWQEGMYRKCLEYGVEAVTLLGWKLSAVEHNIRFLAEFSWNTSLTAQSFYADYVRRLYGQDAAPLAEVYLSYDVMAPQMPPATSADDRPMLLSAGWAELAIPAFPVNAEGLSEASWPNTVKRAGEIAALQRALLQKDRDAIALLGSIIPSLDDQGQSWAALMLNRLRFRCDYLESMISLNEAYTALAEQAAAAGFEAGLAAAGAKLQQSLDFARQAIEVYARDIRNRSDLGAIAQLNEQFYKPLTRLLASVVKQ